VAGSRRHDHRLETPALVVGLRDEGFVGRGGNRHRGNPVDAGGHCYCFRRIEKIHQHRPGRMDGGAGPDRLGGGRGVHDHKDLLGGSNPARISQQAGGAKVRPKVVMGAGAQRGIESPQIIEFGHQLKPRMGHVEVVAQGRPLFVEPIEHVLPVGRVRAAVKILLRAVVQRGNAPRGVHEDQGHLQTSCGAARGIQKTWVVMVVQIQDQRIQGGGIVVSRGQIVVTALNLAGVAGGRGKHAAHLVIERIVEHALHFVDPAGFRARVGTHLGIGSVKHLPELEKIRFVRGLGRRPDRG